MLERYTEELESNQFQLGHLRGTLATALSILTDVQIAAGLHAVYCRDMTDREQDSSEIRTIQDGVEAARKLLQQAMVEG